MSPGPRLAALGPLAGLVPSPSDGHLAAVKCLSFSQDGKRLVSGSDDETLLVWDVESGQIVQRLNGHQGNVSACAFLSDDRVASGGQDGAHVWDVATGKRILDFKGLGADERVRALRTSAQGSSSCEVLLGTEGGEVVGWDACADRETFRKRYATDKPAVQVGYLRDGGRYAVGPQGATLWRGDQVFNMPGWFLGADATSDGRVVVVGPDGVSTLSPTTWRPAKASSETATGKITVAISSAGNALLLGERATYRSKDSESADLFIFKLGPSAAALSGAFVCNVVGDDTFMSSAWSADGGHFAAGTVSGAIYLGAFPCVQEGARVLQASRRRVQAVAVGESSIYVGDDSGRVSQWARGTWRFEGSAASSSREVTKIVAKPGGGWLSYGNGAVSEGSGRVATGLFWGLYKSQVSLAARSATEFFLSVGTRVYQFGPDGKGLLEVGQIEGAKSIVLEPGGAAALAYVDGQAFVRVPLDGSAGEPIAPARPGSTDGIDFTPLSRDALLQTGPKGELWLRRAQTFQSIEGVTRQPKAVALLGERDLWSGDHDGLLLHWAVGASAQPERRVREGAGVTELEGSPDGKFFVVGLADGRAAVRSASDGALIAYLYPFRDGGGATVFADGRVSTTGGVARQQRFEDPSSRKVVTLGDLVSILVTGVSTTPQPDGSVVLQATVFSRGGPPSITVDGALKVDARESPTVRSAYDVRLQLMAPAGKHVIKAASPSGDRHEAGFEIVPSVRGQVDGARALIVGNSLYEGRPKLPGVAKDLAAVDAFLRGEEGWGLPANRVVSRANLRSGELRHEVEQFFKKAPLGETLFVYFAGHGEHEQRGGDVAEGFLLPVDAPANSHKGALTTKDLWKFATESDAARVLIVIDACHAGSFALPSLVPKPSGPGVAIVAATSATTRAREGASGGAFTRAFLAALRDEANVDSKARAVTTAKAYYATGSAVADQSPAWTGSDEVKQMPIAWPRRKETKVAAVVVPSSGDTGFRDAEASLVTATRGPGVETRALKAGALEIKVRLDRAVEAVEAIAEQPDEAPRRSFFQATPEGSVWREGERVTISVEGVRSDKDTTLKLRLCSRDGAKCGPPKLMQLPAQ